VSASAATTGEQPSLGDDLRALARCPRELWLVYLATFLEVVGITSFLVTLPLWLTSDFGMSDERAGWWAATMATLSSLFVFLVGSIADSIGVRRALILSFAFAAVTRLGMMLAPTATGAVVALLVYAFALATATPVLLTAGQRASTKRTRAFAFSFFYVSSNVGSGVAGFVVDATRRLFLDPTTHKLVHHVVTLPLLGDREMTANGAIMGFGFLSSTLAALVTLFMRRGFEERPDPDGEPPRTAAKASPLAALRDVVRDRAFWRFLLLLLFLSLVRMMFQHMHFTWPKYVTRELGDAFPVGRVWSINSLLILGLAPLATALTRRRKPFDVLLVGAFIASLSPFFLCFGSSMAFQVTTIVVLTIGEALFMPRLYEYNLAIAPRGREATYVSLAALPWFLAKFFVGPASGYLLSAYCPAEGPRRPAILWGLIGAMTMVGPIAIWLCRGWIRQKDELAKA
jgi:MFS family permease